MCRGSQYPTGWKETTLGDLAHYINGYAFRPEDWKKVGLPIIRIQQINDPEAEYDCFDGPIADQYRIDNGDLLFSWSATLTTLIWNRGPAVLNQHIFKVIPGEGADLHFLHHLLEYLMDDLAGQTHGSTMRHIKRSDLLPFPVVVPPPEEQRCIAEILDAADEAIRQTERLIAKLKAVKAGLLHDLLTRGLDEHGHLRDPQAHPEQFKDSPLGRIPREWEQCTMGDLISFIKSGLSRAITFDDIGLPVITSTNIVSDRLDVSELKYWYESDPQGANTTDYVLDDGDVLLNFINSIAQIGKACIFRDIGRPAIYTTNIFRIKASEKVRSEFLWRLLQSDHVQHWIQMITKPAINQASFTKPDFASIPVIIPEIKEQERILTVLDAHDACICAEEAELAKLRQVKRGLMDDLLTGKVRVASE